MGQILTLILRIFLLNRNHFIRCIIRLLDFIRYFIMGQHSR